MTNPLSYPIGKFNLSLSRDPAARADAINTISELPVRMLEAVAGLTDGQLDTPYRPDGWTVRQLVHHVADSHIHAYLRMKFALAEDSPTIKPYDQDAWVTMADSRLPIDTSLAILEGLHARWTRLWRSLSSDQFSRTFTHPEIGQVTLDGLLQIYAWHSRHHVAHITEMRQRLGW